MSDAGQTLREAAQRVGAVSDTPRLDAELLLAHALGIERSQLLLDPARYDIPGGFADLIARRLAHEPVAYILGYREFWSLRFSVGPGVLIPRPDSETLIEACLDAARARYPEKWPQSILDLGCGPGTLLLAALSEFSGATGLGVDMAGTALDFAKANATALGLADRAHFQAGNWGEGLDRRFDLILCNPPYISDSEALMPDVARHEPHGALFAGPDGLDDYRRIMPDLTCLLARDGVVVFEIGAKQHAAVAALATAHGFSVQCRQDLAGHDRALVLTWRQ